MVYMYMTSSDAPVDAEASAHSSSDAQFLSKYQNDGMNNESWS